MASVYDYTFYNLSGLEDDKCYLTEREQQNSKFSTYSTTNYFSNYCGLKQPIELATSQPNVFIKGGYGNSGAGGCNIDTDSNMKIGTIQTNPKCRISLQTRQFVTVPYLGRGILNSYLESKLQQGDYATNKKSCSTVTETSYIPYKNYPLLPELSATIQNPVNLVESTASEGWQRGGIPTRELIRDSDYLKKYNN